ncbi:MAG: SDR family NAD(P)-dependent oxidoreductase [Gemmobacter sp.]|uniref:SDR family NAD(P)-dependent oxidoreductase n=1 Tax=Gemmobacter sp. TaxID=1898957 RepID=UPI003919B8A2
MRSPSTLPAQTALVTGATRGIGLALVQALAARGDAAHGTCRTAPGPGPATWHRADVTDSAALQNLGQAWTSPLDLLVCNAGIYPGRGGTPDRGFPAEDWAAAFAVNVTGVFLTVQALLPALARAERPHIAIIASAMGSDARAPGGSYIYRASRAAALNLGRNLAADLAPHGIAVGILSPRLGPHRHGRRGRRARRGHFDPEPAGALRRARPCRYGLLRNHDGRPIPF